eukprot:COSAG02_NODE_1167_length_14137_cov_25.567175_8_plen_69_part_00
MNYNQIVRSPSGGGQDPDLTGGKCVPYSSTYHSSVHACIATFDGLMVMMQVKLGEVPVYAPVRGSVVA